VVVLTVDPALISDAGGRQESKQHVGAVAGSREVWDDLTGSEICGLLARPVVLRSVGEGLDGD
jgi:hypothetical protein